MSIIQSLFSVFFFIINNVVSAAPFLCYLVIAAFTSALIFNIIHIFMGGK